MSASIIINAGSEIAETGSGWTNTYEGALAQAERWLAQIRADGLSDIELLRPGCDPVERDGRWKFGFRHHVTGVTLVLETHGISDMDAYMVRNIFGARVYWNGSSCSHPELGQWAAPGFVQTFRAVDAPACGAL